MSSARITGGTGDSPTAVVDLHVIHGVKVSELLAARCRPPDWFFLSSTTAQTTAREQGRVLSLIHI